MISVKSTYLPCRFGCFEHLAQFAFRPDDVLGHPFHSSEWSRIFGASFETVCLRFALRRARRRNRLVALFCLRSLSAMR
jgi:hypothetical protein